jgi:cell division protein FtsB
LDEALKVNEIRIKGKKSGTRLFSLITFERSLLYELAKNTTQEKKYLILSAISDIEASVKDNPSLSKLAMIFYKENKIYKAHKYINFSLDDAKFFNSKLRFINLSKILTLITEAYEKQSDHQKNKLTNSLYFISALAAFLFFTLIFIYKQNKNLSIARKQLKNNNAELKNLNSQLNNSNNELKDLYQKLLKADLVKEKYVGTFLNLYSDYINKLDLYRKLVKKHIKLDRIDELLKITESKQVIDTEIKIFHKNFDESFLHIYPNFIEQFNTLLKKDKQVTLKKGELLNTELRIYALIRLGINNSDQIATILRYSVSTIYNYRVKLKNNSLHTRDNFEDEVKKIS